MSKINVYTDGSCWPNTGEGNGTFGFLVVIDDKVVHTFIDGRTKTTNNRMEMLGVITAFKYLLQNHLNEQAIVFSDSQYVVKGFNEWYFGWLKKPAKFETLKNVDMWHYMHGLRSDNITLEWVKGHDVNQYNNMIDELISEEFKVRYGKRPAK
jgi:ribonuclease HI